MIKFILPTRSTWVHLRFLYSLYLLPVFLFALSSVPIWKGMQTLGVFLILHLFIYPASNGYNSYFDKDEGSIGGVKTPPKVDKTLLYAAWFLDIIGTFWGFLIRWEFGAGILLYGIFSKLYSHPKIRLKSKPFLSFLVVFFFQGAFIYYLTIVAVSGQTLDVSFLKEGALGALFSSLMVGSMYVITQIYQHKEDQLRGDITLSALLGLKGSFFFSGSCFLGGSLVLYWHFIHQPTFWFSFLAFTLPLVSYFLYWFFKVWQSGAEANFKNTMRMSTLSFLCLSAYFLFLILFKINHQLIKFI